MIDELRYCEIDSPPLQVISKKGPHPPMQRRKPAADIVSYGIRLLPDYSILIVSFILSYITAARNRIEESELEKTSWISRLCSSKGILPEDSIPCVREVLTNLCSSFRDILVYAHYRYYVYQASYSSIIFLEELRYGSYSSPNTLEDIFLIDAYISQVKLEDAKLKRRSTD